MPSPATIAEFLDLVRKSEVVDERKLASYLERQGASLPSQPVQFAGLLVRDGLLTTFQAEQFLLGKWRRFTIGRYKVLERLGQGGMGAVYLCEHTVGRRRVAVKVLPTAKAEDPAALERFRREARALAALNHPNIVRAYDIDVDDNLNFLVMEFIDGASLQEIVKRSGPLDPLRACHYIYQSALGLQHAHEKAGLVHRDIEPGNILVDRSGIVKILDMGLARFFHDEDDILTRKYDETVLGTADYLAPEQALDSHEVDIRADVYSLGGTFYFCLTGRTPFSEGTVAQKLIWHQTRQPKSIRTLRQDVPDGVLAILDRMMAKNAADRYQTPLQVAEALAPFTRTPIPPPPESEMPQLSLAAMAPNLGQPTGATADSPTDDSGSGSGRKPWKVSGQVPAAPPSTTPAVAPPTSVAAPPAPMNVPAPVAVPTTPVANPRRPVAPAPTPSVAVVPSPVPTATARPVAARPAPPAPPAPPADRPIAPALPSRPLKPSPEKAPVAVMRNPANEESPNWQDLAPRTDAVNGRSEAPSPVSPRRAARLSPRAVRNIVLSVAGVLLLGGIVFFVWYALLPGTPPAEPPAPPRVTLYVHRDGANNAYKTLKQALAHATLGDTIILQSDITEAVEGELSGRTIRGEGNIVWKAPPGRASGVLLQVRNAREFILKGLTLDGDGQIDVLVDLQKSCPGTRFEDVTLTHARKACIQFNNCSGTQDQPLVFQKTRFITDENQTALQFRFDTKLQFNVPFTGYITVRPDCIFEGRGRKVTYQADPRSFKADTIKLPPGVSPEKEN